MMSMSFRQLLQELSHKPVQKKITATFQETEKKDWGQLRQAIEKAEANESSIISDAKQGRNYNLNRYSDIVPYNNNRVRLSGKNDYINATHVTLPEAISSMRYIATQGPLNHTIGDFWQMAWEQHAQAIVMLANTVEAKLPKCAAYWPAAVGQTIAPKSSSGHGSGISVTLQDERLLDMVSGVVVRTLLLRHEMHPAEPRTVRQLHYTEWPDHGVPLSPVPLLRMLKELDSANLGRAGSPVVVHCSAGVGRTGTLITLDTAMQFFAKHEDYAGDLVADVFKCLREQRTLMVQNQQQFVFCYQAELEQWNQAVEFFDQREYDSALEIEAYTKALELDQYLVVAYFQRGVAKMVLQRNDQALDDFNKALQYLRDNEFIDYTQIGLDYKVYTCEVLYNRALCFFCLGQEKDAQADLDDASKHTVEERHTWVKKAVQCNGMDCPLYCVPKGVIYRPSASKLKSTKKIDFLGSAKVIASADGKDNFTGFKGALVRKETLKNMASMTHQKSMRVKRSSPPPDLSNNSLLARSNTMPVHRNDTLPQMQHAPSASHVGMSQSMGSNGGGYPLHNGTNSSRGPAMAARSGGSGSLVKMQSTGSLSTVKEAPYAPGSDRENDSDGGGSAVSSPADMPMNIHSDDTSPDVLSPVPKPAANRSPGADSGQRGPVDPLDIIRAGLARRATLKNQQQQQPQQGPRPGLPQRSLTMKSHGPTHEIDYSGINGSSTGSYPGNSGIRRMNTMGSSAPTGGYMERHNNNVNNRNMDDIYEEDPSPVPTEARVARTEIIAPAVQKNISTGAGRASPDFYGSSDDMSPAAQIQQHNAGRSNSLPQHPGIAHAQSSINSVMMSPPLSHEEISAARGVTGLQGSSSNGSHQQHHMGTYGSASSLSPPPSVLSPTGSAIGHYSPLNGSGSNSANPPMSAGSGILRRAPTKKDAMKVKVHYGQEIVNLMIPKHASFDLLRAKVEAKVLASTNAGQDGGDKKSGSLRIRYLDEDGEAVLMTDEDDFELAKAYAGGDMSSPETNVVERLELWSSF
ncbi:hypothetical protein IW138_003530 [Coemansia sp. RSA 986]|nr:hypothetical protein IW138_003530 [Coemansia sp. RSA 986]